MSVNHYSSEIQEALWWQQSQSHHHMMESSKNNNIPNNATATSFWSHPLPPPANNYSFDLNNNEDDEENDEQLTDERENTSSSNNNNNNNYNILRENEESMEVHEIIPKQPLFEKPLTPSDVGKLNRLVIPKQHAEKYFPLNNNNNGGSNESGEKGLLLSFEDELGKPWRFRYSYWNSSQSYVFTKGWSRFVKEKRLDAGDVVLFQRHRIDCDRLFIGWRRRSAAAAVVSENNGGVQSAQTGAGGGGWTGLFSPGHHPYPAQTQQAGHGPANSYQPDCLHAASGLQGQTTPPTSANANSKRFRLFGVNLDLGCQTDESEPPPPEDGSSVSSQTQTHYHHQYQYHTNSKLQAYNHQNHKDINFSRDVNQTRYHQG